MEGERGNRPPAPPLEAPPVQRHSTLLLPGRSRGDRHLAHRGGASVGTRREGIPRPPGQRQPGRQSGAAPSGSEAGHGNRKDHRHGDAHRLAHHQRRPPPPEPQVHARLPGGDPRHHHQGPAAGAAAQRSGQLLPEPRAGPERHAARPGTGEDRHHQLPRFQAARAPEDVQRRPHPAPGKRRAAQDARNRGGRCSSASCPS